jgi:hypothetical protein
MRRARRFSFFAAFLLLLASVPAPAQEGRIVRPQYGGFGLEVVADGGPLDIIYGRGRRYVEAREGAEYELVVRNPLPVRVAVALSVDGRHTSAWEASKWVIEPYGTIRISGWQMSSTRARHFYFTTERDSYAARLGRARDLGVITAVFYREIVPRPYTVTPAPPYDEPVRPQSRNNELPEGELRSEAPKSRSSAGSSAVRPRRDDDGYAATGIGRSVYHDVQWVQMRLDRTPAAEVSIRYEYRDALVRLGLLPRPWPDDNALRRRERARGFEGPYSPEP